MARAAVVVLLVPIVVLLLVLGAWALDTQGDEGGVLRGAEVAGRSIGGLSGAELDSVLSHLAAEYPAATVQVETPQGDMQATGAEVGLELDVEATRDEVLALGRQGGAPQRFREWLRSLTTNRPAEVRVTLDRTLLASVVQERDPTGRTRPVEPGITTEEGELVVVPGVDGSGLDPAPIGDRIVAEATDGVLPVVVRSEAVPIPPRFTDADAERLVERADDLTEEPLSVIAGETGAQVPSERMRTWLRSVPAADGLQLEVDQALVATDLVALLSDVGRPPTDASFRVEDDTVVIVPGMSGTRCCGEDAAARVGEAVLDRPAAPVTVPLTEAPPMRTVADAEALGIDQPISSFTTSFPPGESRVQNIHRISDLTRGVVVEPGGTFSVNDHVGRRTEEKGFTTGGVIQDGVFDESIGGGISQYATTLFNAAFFGGLDFGAYQSHSIHISRYPYGREATLSFPEPDLVIENDTPHGVLIWTTHTPSSVTVTLWSTPFARGEQTDQTEVQVGACTRVTTERTRTFVDGHTELDHVHATYRPEEGVDC